MASPIFRGADSSRPSLHLTTASAQTGYFVPSHSSSASLVLSQSRKSLQSTPELNHRSQKRTKRAEDNATGSSVSGRPKRNVRVATTNRPARAQSQEPESPMPMTNTQYDLAGGLDTPGATRLDEEEEREMALQMADYRTNRYNLHNTVGSHDKPATPSLRAGPQGRKRARSTDQTSWGRVVLNVVGGVAGKVIDFCWSNGTFGGFQAGGGQAYPVDLGTPSVVGQGKWSTVDERDDVFNNTRSDEGPMTNSIPGQFPEEEFIPDYMSHPWSHGREIPTPAPSRHEGHALDGNWVFVRTPDGLNNDSARRSQDDRYSKGMGFGLSEPSPMMQGSRAQTKASRAALVGSPGSRLNRPASFASPRASAGRLSSKAEYAWSAGRTDINKGSRPATPSPRRTATHAITRKSCGTPTSPEFQRYEKRMKRMAKQEDESLTRLNRQLQSLIKEGKEALGTTFEVDVHDDHAADGWT